MQEISSLLIQIPIVAAFIWFVLEMDKRNKAYFVNRDERFSQAMDKLVGRIEYLDTNLSNHDAKTDKAIARMEERTRTRPTRAAK